MKQYVRETSLSSKALAKRCGVSHSQMYMARTRNVGPENAEKIAWCVANMLGLSQAQKLELKAQIMGEPQNMVAVYLGTIPNAMKILGISENGAREVLDPEKSIRHSVGVRAVRRLREIGAPEEVVVSVDRRVMPPPKPRRGLITFRRAGPEVAAQRKETKESLARHKPHTHAALKDSGLMLKELRVRAGVGKETVRRALYQRCGERSASRIAEVLKDAAGLSEAQAEAVEVELKTHPEEL